MYGYGISHASRRLPAESQTLAQQKVHEAFGRSTHGSNFLLVLQRGEKKFRGDIITPTTPVKEKTP
jgi:hypothetical protein